MYIEIHHLQWGHMEHISTVPSSPQPTSKPAHSMSGYKVSPSVVILVYLSFLYTVVVLIHSVVV